jgi:DNA polymerase-1
MTTATTLPMLKDKQLLLILDGHALVHRAWHAIREPMTVRSTGEEVRAVYGFLNSFIKTISDRNPTHIVITFDLPKPTFRHLKFKEYKAHRPPTPPELISQFGRIRQLMKSFGVPIFEQEGFEADDLIGTLCHQAEEQEVDTIVLTGDTDTLQLVSPHIRVLLSFAVQKRTLYDEVAVRERYGGLGPESIAEIKALEGDTSDNIPGVPGIGRKTAIKLLAEFGSLDGIYEHLEVVTPPRAKKSLTENREIAERALFLTTILRDAPVTLDMEASEFWKFDRSKVVDFLKELEFFSMVSRIPNNAHGEQLSMMADAEPDFVSAPVDYEIVDTEEALDDLVVELSKPYGFSFDTETDSIDPMLAQLVGLSFSNSPQKAWYVPVGHNEGKQIPMERVLERLGPILTDPNIPKVAHNANYDMMVLENQGIRLQGLELDTMLAAHASGRRSVGLKALALDMFHEEMMPITDLIGKGRKQITMAEVEIEKAVPYAAADADFTERLRGELSKELEDRDLRKLVDDVETPLVQVLVRMQRDGVGLDVDLLNKMSEELSGQLKSIQANMYSTVGHEFNLNSSQQLGDVLFNELHLPPTKRTKTGHSTDAASLDGLKVFLDSGKAEGVDPKSYGVLDLILEYRQLSKIKSTYVDALPGLVNPNTGRIHTRYNQVGSATGRVSSNDPNVQNIPVRTELGRQVRKAFVAEGAPEWSLLAADYSQIELRVLAHISKDPVLVEAFHRGEDIHSSTSSMVYDVPIDDVTADQRRFAKILNFGVLYGLTAFGISRQTDLSPDQGQHFIDVYFDRYPLIRAYTDETKERCRALGYVQTVLGRRRYLPDITSRNFNVRNAAERAAINMPIQGTAADIIKIAMINIMERMDDLGMRSKMILQVHDELIFEVPKDEMDQMQAVIMELMPSALAMDVPLGVELKSGYTWGDMD